MNTKDNSVEIDILHLLNKLWLKKFLILFVAVFFGAVAFLGSTFFIKPEYTAKTRIYVVNQNSNNTANNLTAQDLQAGTYLVSDYKEIIVSREVLSSVIANINLDLTPEELEEKINVEIPTDTRVISISVTDTSAQEAANISNAIRNEAANKIKSVTKVQDVTTLEKAEVPTKPSSPNIHKNSAIGFLLGIFITTIAIVIKELLDDRIKRPEDVEEILKMTLLGVVPNTKKL